jgi:hypothetical protein
MARRSNSKTTEAPEADITTEAPEEATVSTTTEEAPVETTEATSTESTPEAPIDLTGFEASVTEAVAQADESTGMVPEASLGSVLEQYRSLDGVKAKNKAKAHLNDGMKSAMNDGDIAKARAFLQLSENMTAGSSKSSGEKAPADPTEAAAQRIATLQLAAAYAVVPDGVSGDLDAKVAELTAASEAGVQSYLEWSQADEESRGDEPEVSAVARNAAKLALGKAAKAGARSGSTFTGERRDIGKHIAEAFESVESGGFLTVAEIRNFKSAEYGDTPPSAGAISARLFPTGGGDCTIEGISGDTNDKGNKGGRKA